MSKKSGTAARLARTAVIALAAAFLATFSAVVLASGTPFEAAAAGVAATQLAPRLARIAAAGFGIGTAITIGMLVATAIFGRWYCAVLCPLGTAQDAVGALRPRSAPATYRRNQPVLRAASLVLVVALFVFGASAIAGWLDPYTISARFLRYALFPLLETLQAFSAQIARRSGLYWTSDIEAFAWFSFLSAALPLAAILFLARRSGRLFCGTLCPLGALLGFLGRTAPFRVRLDGDACVRCGACTRGCPARCVDGAAMRIDPSRCVTCLACIAPCPTGALYYGPPRRVSGRSGIVDYDARRRTFLRAGVTRGAAILVGLSIGKRTSAVGSTGLDPAPAAMPPGARSFDRFRTACTACGLCVSKCPSGVLRPAATQYGIRGFLAPYLDYERSYCQYECVTCAAVCPTGALRRLSFEEKRLVQIGTAALVRERCIVIEKKTACGACAEHCPTGAVRMISIAGGISEPVFDEAICIGCGACHHICPALPLKAITVSGLRVHGTASAPSKRLFSLPAVPVPAAGDPPTAAPQPAPPAAFPF